MDEDLKRIFGELTKGINKLSDKIDDIADGSKSNSTSGRSLAARDMRTSLGRNANENSAFSRNKNGYYGRDDAGHFDGTGSLKGLVEQVKKVEAEYNKQEKVLNHNQKLLDDINKYYGKTKSSMSREERAKIDNQIRLEQAFINETKVRNEYNKFLKDNLAKTIEIQNTELEARKKREEWELKGYNKSGRRNSGAEAFNAIGRFAHDLKTDSIGRNIGKGLSSVINTTAKAGAFINAGKLDVSSMADKVSGKLMSSGNPYAAAAGGLIQILKTAFEMYSKVNTAASKFARTVGGGKDAVASMELHIAKVATTLSSMDNKILPSWGKRVYDAAKLMESMAEYSTTLGRNTQFLGEQDIKALQDLKDYGIGMDILSQFDTFGISLTRASEQLAGMYSSASQKGLNAKAVTDAMTKNLKMAQSYTFAGGQRALARMAEKSVALKYNMESAARFADKVSTLEGAAQAGANLSVLGGSFARVGGNPLSMLYGGLQDTERLNDMMLNMTKNMAQWDSQNKEMRISAYNRQRMKAAASAMGVDYNDMVNQAMSQGRRNRVDAQMGNRITDEKTRELVRNIATLDEEGRAKVNINTGRKDELGLDIYEEKLVSALTEADKKALEEESRRKGQKDKATIGDILEQTMSTQDRLDALIEAVKVKLTGIVMGIYNLIAKWSGKGKQETIETFGMSDNQKSDYEKIQNIKNNNAFVGNEKFLSQYGINSEEQLKNASNSEIAQAIQSKQENKSRGGLIRGKGTSMSDSIPANLSDGEYVMNAKATKKHLGTLQAWNAEGFAYGTTTPIRTGSNPYNQLSVTPIAGSAPQIGSISPMKIEPLNVNINGRIELTSNGTSTTIDTKTLLQDSRFIQELIRQIEIGTNHALDKSKIHMKYPY